MDAVGSERAAVMGESEGGALAIPAPSKQALARTANMG
jgi:hypothetical protein